MQSISNNIYRLTLIITISLLSACVVKPKTVASYNDKCMVSTQKMVLTAEQMQTFDVLNCVTGNCEAEAILAVVTTTTSAIVSGSIALIGNTLYWMESQGKCPNMVKPSEQEPGELQSPADEYTLEEEIITAKS